MKKTVLMVLTPLFADWEAAFVAPALNDSVHGKDSPYAVKTVGLTGEPVRSIGGLTVLTDHSLADAPEEYTAVLLIGGMSWCTAERRQTEISRQVVPLVQAAMDRKAVVGAICDATTFLGANGWLNEVAHTSNTLDDLRQVAGDNYRNAEGYVEQQSVRGGNVVTANGTGYMEFTRDVLLSLGAYPREDIEKHYDFYKVGFYEAMKRHPDMLKGL